jgi:lysozyme
MNARQTPTRASKRGLAAIVAREGVRLTAYPDPATKGEPYTIGVGHTGGVKPGQKITMAEAFRLLAKDCEVVENTLGWLTLPDQRMFDACVSLGINLGPGIFDRSHTVGRLLHERRWQLAADSFLLYDVANRKHMLGLLNRRKSERRQFLRGLAAFKRRQRAARL